MINLKKLLVSTFILIFFSIGINIVINASENLPSDIDDDGSLPIFIWNPAPFEGWSKKSPNNTSSPTNGEDCITSISASSGNP